MKIRKLTSIVLLFVAATACVAQDNSDYLQKRWRNVATKMPSEWYGSEEAKKVAENVLLSQKEIGGWEKNKAYHHPFSESERAHYINSKSEIGATFDNRSTIIELRFLAKVYASFGDIRYKLAFENGLNYIFISQYSNGGWPQYFPVKSTEDEIRLDKTEPYSGHITYNDGAMVNTMEFLKEVISDDPEFSSLEINEEIIEKAQKAFDKGIECILKTQIMVDGAPTVWCAQHHEITLEPANARSYELASFSGAESVGVLLLLMDLNNPSDEIKTSVNGAIAWFENHKIEGIKISSEKLEDGRRNRIELKDENASSVWGRFYDLETGIIFFCDRDGIKKNSLAEIGYNRRNGYSWYTKAPSKALKLYPSWLEKNK